MSNLHTYERRLGAWNNSWNRRKSEYSRVKPEGGYCFISAMALIRAWWAYKRRIIRLFDLRVWFACFEVVARRCDVAPNRFPRYSFDEVHRLVGGKNPAQVQTAVRRLTNAGLLNWSERQIRFATYDRDFALDCDPDFQRMLDLVVNHRRKVPVPRRTIRFLSAMTRPVCMATMIGHLLRCLYYRKGRCAPEGRCKTSWIAETFSVDIRNVKAARAYLDDIEWLVVEASSQTAMNRWGAAVRINLSWKDEHECEGKTPPPPSRQPSQSPLPRNNRKLSSRSEDQKPVSTVRTGACAFAAPNLRNIRPEDLRDAHRLDFLLVEARRRNLLPAGEAARLRFHSAAAHAVRVGSRNPAGLFAAIVHRRLWTYLSTVDEDQARRQLAGLRQGFPAKTGRCVTDPLVCREPTTVCAVLSAILPRLQMVGSNTG